MANLDKLTGDLQQRTAAWEESKAAQEAELSSWQATLQVLPRPSSNSPSCADLHTCTGIPTADSLRKACLLFGRPDSIILRALFPASACLLTHVILISPLLLQEKEARNAEAAKKAQECSALSPPYESFTCHCDVLKALLTCRQMHQDSLHAKSSDSRQSAC